jgi:hypothetical protein
MFSFEIILKKKDSHRLMHPLFIMQERIETKGIDGDGRRTFQKKNFELSSDINLDTTNS